MISHAPYYAHWQYKQLSVGTLTLLAIVFCGRQDKLPLTDRSSPPRHLTLSTENKHDEAQMLLFSLNVKIFKLSVLQNIFCNEEKKRKNLLILTAV